MAYLYIADSARLVSKQADRYIFRTERPKLQALGPFDKQGRWVGDEDALWSTEVTPVVSLTLQLSGLEDATVQS
ncbi:hypothetical protein [Mycetocola sp.]|uniref:hypothetical protein n=1 Tax=Mycetocola sp. TaxID=1871042 RepID=UPI0039891F8C